MNNEERGNSELFLCIGDLISTALGGLEYNMNCNEKKVLVWTGNGTTDPWISEPMRRPQTLVP
jgi:hypothetical protein